MQRTLSIAVFACLGALTGCAAPRATTTIEPVHTALSGSIDHGVYTAPNGTFRVRVPPVFADWSEGEKRIDWTDLSAEMPIHPGLRVEDGREEVEGNRISWVMFGPSPWQTDEIYHVVVAEPAPYHRYENIDHHASDVIDGYLDQYDAQYHGRAVQLAARHVKIGARDAVYEAFRYDFSPGGGAGAADYRFYASFCLFNTPGHRLVTFLIEQRPGPSGSRGENWEQWREQSYATGSCWDEWIATLDIDDSERPPLTFH